ncbi:MAG TPA: ATP-binding protein [Bacteroidales bacterium]|nr:ATP-binding protein [Bacteroidales bacterium]HRX97179.1 ATP-binding protein [Bacteroidales bacterium]
MRKHGFEIIVGLLVSASVLLVLAVGYFSYLRISAIIDGIHAETQPDEKLAMIKKIATDLDHAENSVRLYGLTKNKSDINSFNKVITSLDEQITGLQSKGAGNNLLQNNLDTIGNLISEKVYVWREMIALYNTNVAELYLDTISTQLESKIESDSIRKNRGILKKIFQRQKKQELNEEKIISDIEQFKVEDKKYADRIRQKELQLARTNNQLTQKIYTLLDKMEEQELDERLHRAEKARLLAEETYTYIGGFIISATLLGLIVIFVILNYVRKRRKSQQALIKAKDEAENLAKTKEMFIANVSHEIRTPMNVISGFVNQLLNNRAADGVKDTLKIIQSSSDHLVRIINDILDFSKLESGKMKLEQTDFNPAEVMNEVLMLFNGKAAENHTSLQSKVDENFPEALVGDPIRLKQILINLVGNAIKFTKNGTVTFSIKAEDHISNNLVMLLTVEDTGIGIDQDKIDKIFEDFTQAEKDTSRKFGGTGLGLSIVKQLVDLHNGKIKVVSQKNQGSKFICKIPYKVGNISNMVSIASEHFEIPDELKQKKVLIVDDEAYNRKLIKTILDKWGVLSEEAEDGMEAIELVKNRKYDFILMDVRMPGLDGFKVTRFIRQTLNINPNQTAIILISAGTVNQDQIESYKQQGINDYLPKPFAESLLLNSMNEFLKTGVIAAPKKGEKIDTQTTNSEAAINLLELYRVADNDSNFVKEMLERFIESFEQGMESIKSGLLRQEWEQIGNAAHKMASPCRHIGAKHLLNNLKKIESLADEKGGMDTIQNLIPELEHEYEVVKKQITEHIASLSK